jgi:ATP-dependent phosphofructokinase / diphosphate-dependent phosphofructokinase
MKHRIGILTGGGDCPGLNAVIRAVFRRAEQFDYEVIGIRDGWKGLLEMDCEPLSRQQVSGIHLFGGTILGTSRTNPFKKENGAEIVAENMKKMDLYALIAVGGDDTLGVCNKLSKMGLNTVGVPKTIDNDLSATDVTFGYDTAVSIATECIDRLHTTAESHHRTLVVELMGRHAGWITCAAGIAGGADMILVPEEPFNIVEVCNVLKKRAARGKKFNIVAVSEGAKFSDAPGVEGSVVLQTADRDAFGNVRLGGIANILAKEIETRTGFETRSVILGHLQRGGTPTAYDRVLATRFGVKAVELVHEGRFGLMVAIHGTKIEAVPLEEAVGKTKTLDMELYETAKIFFG